MLPEATREGLPVAGLSIASETWQPSFVTGQGLLPTVGRPGARVKASVAPPCPVAAEDNAKPEHILLGMQGHSANSHHMQQVELKAQVKVQWAGDGVTHSTPSPFHPFHPQPSRQTCFSLTGNTTVACAP